MTPTVMIRIVIGREAAHLRSDRVVLQYRRSIQLVTIVLFITLERMTPKRIFTHRWPAEVFIASNNFGFDRRAYGNSETIKSFCFKFEIYPFFRWVASGVDRRRLSFVPVQLNMTCQLYTRFNCILKRPMKVM